MGTGKDESDYKKDFWKYNAGEDAWTQIAELIADKRSGAVAFNVNDKGYISGGQYYDSYTIQLSDVQEYNPATNTWTEKIAADGTNLSFNSATIYRKSGIFYHMVGNSSYIINRSRYHSAIYFFISQR